MTIAAPTRRRPCSAQREVRPQRPKHTARARDQQLRDARVLEVRARRRLGLTYKAMARTYAVAERSIDDFDVYLAAIRRQLKQAGYLANCGTVSQV